MTTRSRRCDPPSSARQNTWAATRSLISVARCSSATEIDVALPQLPDRLHRGIDQLTVDRGDIGARVQRLVSDSQREPGLTLPDRLQVTLPQLAVQWARGKRARAMTRGPAPSRQQRAGRSVCDSSAPRSPRRGGTRALGRLDTAAFRPRSGSRHAGRGRAAASARLPRAVGSASPPLVPRSVAGPRARAMLPSSTASTNVSNSESSGPRAVSATDRLYPRAYRKTAGASDPLDEQ